MEGLHAHLANCNKDKIGIAHTLFSAGLQDVCSMHLAGRKQPLGGNAAVIVMKNYFISH